jgi:hypothetical protein
MSTSRIPQQLDLFGAPMADLARCDRARLIQVQSIFSLEAGTDGAFETSSEESELFARSLEKAYSLACIRRVWRVVCDASLDVARVKT